MFAVFYTQLAEANPPLLLRPSLTARSISLGTGGFAFQAGIRSRTFASPSVIVRAERDHSRKGRPHERYLDADRRHDGED